MLLTVEEGEEESNDEESSRTIDSYISSPSRQENYENFTIVESKEIDVDLGKKSGHDLWIFENKFAKSDITHTYFHYL